MKTFREIEEEFEGRGIMKEATKALKRMGFEVVHFYDDHDVKQVEENSIDITRPSKHRPKDFYDFGGMEGYRRVLDNILKPLGFRFDSYRGLSKITVRYMKGDKNG